MNRFANRIKGGFTLIELLVVIAIIGLLAAILFPVFSRVRESARRTTCQSNLKQMALGIVQYTQDNDDRMPFPTIDTTVQPYFKSSQIFRCPSDDSTAATSYAANMIASNVSWNNPGPPYTRPASTVPGNVNGIRIVGVSELKDPSGLIMMADNFDGGSYANTISWPSLASITGADPRRMGNWSERHLETINTLFADGHVKAVKLTYFIEGGNTHLCSQS